MGKSAQWLEIVAKEHESWIKIVNSLGGSSYAEDIVQETYLILYKYTDEKSIIKDGKVNRGYMFFTLRSVQFQFYNAKKKVKIQSIDDKRFFYQIPDSNEMDEEIGYDKFINLLDDKVDSFNWYEKKLFKLYSQTDLSIRKIAAETNISWVSIFNTLKNVKNEIKLDLKEDWEDYKNQDYELLK